MDFCIFHSTCDVKSLVRTSFDCDLFLINFSITKILPLNLKHKGKASALWLKQVVLCICLIFLMYNTTVMTLLENFKVEL